ncbi:hypothetical protein Tco_0492505 [Tanacetum coccineum]
MPDSNKRQLATDPEMCKERFYVAQSEGFVDQSSRKSLPTEESFVWIKTSSKSLFLGDKLVIESKKINCTESMPSAEAEYGAVYLQVCSSNVDQDTTSRLWLQLQQNTVVENGIIELYFVRTEYQLADMFTKALPEDRFKYLVRRIGMRCLTPAELEVLTNETA